MFSLKNYSTNIKILVILIFILDIVQNQNLCLIEKNPLMIKEFFLVLGGLILYLIDQCSTRLKHGVLLTNTILGIGLKLTLKKIR